MQRFCTKQTIVHVVRYKKHTQKTHRKKQKQKRIKLQTCFKYRIEEGRIQQLPNGP